MRENYLQKLKEVSQDIMLLGNMAAQALQNAIETLIQNDKEAARALIDADEVINHKRFVIEEQLVQLIAKEQPMAKDLRNIVAHLIVTTELERTADYAAGIAKNAFKMEKSPDADIAQKLQEMSCIVIDMLKQSLQSYMNGDIVAASTVGHQDDEVDQYYHQIYSTLLQMVADGKLPLPDSMRLMWVAHNLERSADRTTNICERAIYAQTGLMKEFEHGI